MRFRELRSDGGWKFVLELHPAVTVLAGLEGDRRDRMAHLLQEALYGRQTDLDGLLEVEGQALVLGDWATRVAGQLNGVELVVRASDLPGMTPPESPGRPSLDDNAGTDLVSSVQRDAARANAEAEQAADVLAAAVAAREQLERGGTLVAAEDQSGAAAARVALAERAVADARAALDALVGNVAPSHGQSGAKAGSGALEDAQRTATEAVKHAAEDRDAALAALAAARAVAATAHETASDLAVVAAEGARRATVSNEEALNAQGAAEAAARLVSERDEALRHAEEAAAEAQRLAADAERVAAEAELRPPPVLVDRSPHEALAAAGVRLQELEAKQRSLTDRVEETRAELDSLDRSRRAETAATNEDDGAAGRGEVAGRLLERLDRLVLHRSQRAPTTGVAAPEWLVTSAREALEQARMEAARAEEAAKPFQISPSDAADLERAHRDVVEAEQRAERAFSGPLANRRLDAARAVERGVLDRIGVPSYSAYLLRSIDVSETSGGTDRLERARRNLADAEAVWEELHSIGAGEDEGDLDTEEAQLRQEAVVLVGPEEAGADLSTIGQRLRALVQAGAVTTEQPTGPDGPTEDLEARRHAAESSMAALESELALVTSSIETARAEMASLEGQARRSDATVEQTSSWSPEIASVARRASAEATRHADELRAQAGRAGAEAAKVVADLERAQAAAAEAGARAARDQRVAEEERRRAADGGDVAGRADTQVDQLEIRAAEAEARVGEALRAEQAADARVAASVSDAAAAQEEQARVRAERAGALQRAEAELVAAQAAMAEAAALAEAPPESTDAAGARGEALQAARRDERIARRQLEEARAAAAVAAARSNVAQERALADRQGDDRRPAAASVNAGALPAAATDAEIYVLARLAAVRSVGTVGALPVVMVEPLVGVDADDRRKVLSLIERMSELIQVIYLTDSPLIVEWAESLGAERAAVRRFGRPVQRDPAA